MFNLLKDDMSIVGQRPIMPHKRKHDGPHIEGYDAARPGVTGLRKLRGRNELSFQQRAELGTEYVPGWSLGQALRIIMTTIPALIFSTGAYEATRRSTLNGKHTAQNAVAERGIRWTVRDLPTAIHHDHAATIPRRELKIVQHHHHRAATGSFVRQGLHQRQLVRDVERCTRLIKQEARSRTDQEAGEMHPRLFPAGQGLDRAPGEVGRI